MKFILGFCIVALVLAAGMAFYQSGRPDYSYNPFPYPTSASDFLRSRGP